MNNPNVSDYFLFLKDRVYIWATLVTMLAVLMSHTWTIFVNIKPFWLDEWFILANIKFRTYSELFGVLEYSQQFPRLYLSLVKWFISWFNYGGIATKMLPFGCAIISGILLYFLAKSNLFKGSLSDICLFTLVFLGNSTTLHYSTQIKHYTMELLCSILAIYQFFYYAKHIQEPRMGNLPADIFFGGIFLFGPFFSYTYPIAACPLIIVFLIGVYGALRDRENATYLIVPLLLFFLSVTIVYIIDVRHILSDNQMKIYWRPYLVSYRNLTDFTTHFARSFGLLFTNIFFVYIPGADLKLKPLVNFLKFATAILTGIGILGCLWDSVIKKIKSSPPFGWFRRSDIPIDLYFAGLFLLIWILYLLKMLPIGPDKLNYFLLPMMAYFFICGLNWIARLNILFIAQIMRWTRLVFLLFFVSNILFIYTQNAAGHVTLYPKEIYNNYGRAIRTAHELNATAIVMLKEAAPWHHVMIIQTHPDYDVGKDLRIYEIAQRTDLCTDKRFSDETGILVLVGHDTVEPLEYQNLCTVNPVDPIEMFVNRLVRYLLVDAGLQSRAQWVEGLNNGAVTAGYVIRQMSRSSRILNERIDDEVYLRNLYKAMFDRAPDAGGLRYWHQQLLIGIDRRDVLDGFISSDEFINLCKTLSLRGDSSG